MLGLTRKGGVLAATAAMLCVSVPANAAMGCWDQTQVAAAKIRDLQSRLMVATLRCSAMGAEISPAYNRFIAANRKTIQSANTVIMAAFRAGHGPRAGEVQYDRFATSLANIYGDDATDPDICADTEATAEEAAEAAGDIRALVALAERTGGSPTLPGGQCPVSFAEMGGN